jgi:hypothetical protein
MTATDYPMGARVTFGDATATTTTDPVVATGTINGDPLTDDDGTVRFVPVFAERDNGREATTVYVAVANVMEVTS